jgi:selenoprotein W-related protein
VAEAVFTEFGLDIASYTLNPGSGGVHDIWLDDDLVFSKKAIGRQPTPEEIIDLIRPRIEAAARG